MDWLPYIGFGTAVVVSLAAVMRWMLRDLRADLGGRIDRLGTRRGQPETRVDRPRTFMGQPETRMDRLETRMGQPATRMDQLEARLDRRIDRLEARIDGLAADLRTVSADLGRVSDRVARIEGALFGPRPVSTPPPRPLRSRPSRRTTTA